MDAASVRARYEAAVRALAADATDKLRQGITEEEVARWIVAERNALKLAYRDLTPPDLLAIIEARTLRVYGNVLGPSVAQLRAHGRSWREIIEAASRAGSLPGA